MNCAHQVLSDQAPQLSPDLNDTPLQDSCAADVNIRWSILYQVPSDQAPHTTRCPSLNLDAPSPSASTTPTPCSDNGAAKIASDTDLDQPASGITAAAHRPLVCQMQGFMTTRHFNK